MAVGSFLNSVVYRLALSNFSFWKNLGGKNRSHCSYCKHTLNWRDLIPVFSFLFLKGRCQYCHKKISWQYPAVEISTGILFILIFWSLEFNWVLGIGTWDLIKICFMFYVASSMVVIFVYDLKHYIIPDKVLFPVIAITFLYRLFEVLDFRILDYILSGLGAGAFFLFIFLVSGGRWMGFGDVKLAFFMGLFLGYPNILAALFLAFFLGAIIGTGLIVFGGKSLKSKIPFGPFLIAGTFLALFWGEQLVNWYLSLFLF